MEERERALRLAWMVPTERACGLGLAAGPAAAAGAGP